MDKTASQSVAERCDIGEHLVQSHSFGQRIGTGLHRDGHQLRYGV